MRKLFLMAMLLATTVSYGQEERSQSDGFPLKVTVFSETVSMPNFRNFFYRKPNLGIRIGTEFYYSHTKGHQWFQTANLGYYSHRHLHNALYLSTEVAYRKFMRNAFADVTVGVGYMIIDSALPRYRNSGEGFEQVSDIFARVMPTLGLGAGYRFNRFSVFTRYELFGEIPFGFKGVPALPHKTLHVGAQFKLSSL